MQTYIAAKKPILAVINGDTAEIVRDNNLGICANPSSIESITKALKRCIKMNRLERQSFTKENNRLLTTIFNKEKTINRLCELTIGKG